MPPVVVPDALLVTASGTIHGQPWANVIGINTGGPEFMSQTTANAIGAQVRSFYDGLKTSFVDEFTMNQIIVADLQSSAAPSFEVTVTPVVGTNASQPLPGNIAMCCTHRTAFRGKSYRGRTYLAGFSANALGTNGLWASGTLALVVTAWNSFRTGLATVSTGQFSHGVVSRALLEVNDVVSTAVNSDVDHQDRRKP